MFKKGFNKAKFTALAVALCAVAMSMKDGTLASANNGQPTYLWPVPDSSQMLREYSDTYDGIDITSISRRTEVIATREGTVEVARSTDCEHENNYPEYCCNNGLGNYVKIRHKDGTYASYSHLKHGSVTVVEGEEVKAGTVIGIMGASGRTKEKCLHFSVAYAPTKTINTNPTELQYTYTTENVAKEEKQDNWIIEAKTGVNFRSGAGTSFDKIGKLEKGTVVKVEEIIEVEDSQWGKVTYQGDIGWFCLKYAQKYEGELRDEEESLGVDVNVRCQLIMDPNGGQCEYSCYMYTKGSKIGTLPIPTRPEYTFVGWYTEKNEGRAINASEVLSEDMTVYAHWEK